MFEPPFKKKKEDVEPLNLYRQIKIFDFLSLILESQVCEGSQLLHLVEPLGSNGSVLSCRAFS